MYGILKQTNLILISFFFVLLSGRIPNKSKHFSNHPFATLMVSHHLDSYDIHTSLKTLNLKGTISFDGIHNAGMDFGKRYHFLPAAVLYPASSSDISSTIKHIYKMGPESELTVAARGHGHSLQGQSLAYRGIVINMESLRIPDIRVHVGELPYVDVSGGELWINILHECLKHGLAPKTWTDYLHLTVGGTLSNAGLSGQAFRHGPQIDNVYQLEVVTGKGDILTCSAKQNAELFYSVLGGLGQFGIITRARISLESAPKKVMWIRVLYSDFSIFTRDQEHLISKNYFDYIEGFVIINRTGLINDWKSSFNSKSPLQASQFISDGRTLFCLELAKYFHSDQIGNISQKTESQLSELSYIPYTLFFSELSYVEFLDRVHTSEIKLRAKGLWDVPHPWMNLLIPKGRIGEFAKEVFGNILVDRSNGPILIYPVNKSKWNNRTSLVTPDEDVFYLVAFLSSAVPSSTGSDGLEHILTQNKMILDFCETASLGMKQYLPFYSNQESWRVHFGPQWEIFAQRKSTYDPLAILAPGQRIFPKVKTYSQNWSLK